MFILKVLLEVTLRGKKQEDGTLRGSNKARMMQIVKWRNTVERADGKEAGRFAGVTREI